MEQSYLNLLKEVLDTGEVRSDRTGVGTIGTFGKQIRFNLQEGFPLLTTKKMSLKSILAELLWFVEGSGDERRLCEITHGTKDPSKSTIWTANANADYWKPKAKFDGDLGRVYGVQWRHWQSYKIVGAEDVIEHGTSSTLYNAKVKMFETDQLQNVVNTLRTNPMDRRMIVSAFNPGELDQMALPPCHMFAQFHVTPSTNSLNCHMYMRSVDTFLGMGYNIASYAALTHMIAQVTGFNVGELVISTGDTHIYLNHVDAVKEQLSREPFKAPKLVLNKSVKEIDDFKLTDFELLDYQSHPSIKAEMAV